MDDSGAARRHTPASTDGMTAQDRDMQLQRDDPRARRDDPLASGSSPGRMSASGLTPANLSRGAGGRVAGGDVGFVQLSLNGGSEADPLVQARIHLGKAYGARRQLESSVLECTRSNDLDSDDLGTLVAKLEGARLLEKEAERRVVFELGNARQTEVANRETALALKPGSLGDGALLQGGNGESGDRWRLRSGGEPARDDTRAVSGPSPVGGGVLLRGRSSDGRGRHSDDLVHYCGNSITVSDLTNAQSVDGLTFDVLTNVRNPVKNEEVFHVGGGGAFIKSVVVKVIMRGPAASTVTPTVGMSVYAYRTPADKFDPDAILFRTADGHPVGLLTGVLSSKLSPYVDAGVLSMSCGRVLFCSTVGVSAATLTVAVRFEGTIPVEAYKSLMDIKWASRLDVLGLAAGLRFTCTPTDLGPAKVDVFCTVFEVLVGGVVLPIKPEDCSLGSISDDVIVLSYLGHEGAAQYQLGDRSFVLKSTGSEADAIQAMVARYPEVFTVTDKSITIASGQSGGFATVVLAVVEVVEGAGLVSLSAGPGNAVAWSACDRSEPFGGRGSVSGGVARVEATPRPVASVGGGVVSVEAGGDESTPPASSGAVSLQGLSGGGTGVVSSENQLGCGSRVGRGPVSGETAGAEATPRAAKGGASSLAVVGGEPSAGLVAPRSLALGAGETGDVLVVRRNRSKKDTRKKSQGVVRKRKNASVGTRKSGKRRSPTVTTSG